MEYSSVEFSSHQNFDERPPAWDCTPTEIWCHIFDLATLLPSYAAIEYAGALDPDDYFNPELRLRWSEVADDALRSSIRCRAVLAQVCAEWRRANVEKVYECIHVTEPSQLEPLGDVLEQSCSTVLPAGYGGRTKQFSWSIPPVKGGRYPTEFVRSTVKILQHLPNLVVFMPSPHVVTTNVPSEILDAILQNETIHSSLRCLRLMGPVDLRDIGKLLTNCRALTSIALGKAWNNLGREKFSLPNLRSLHVELNNSPSSHYIQQFTYGFLPKLEQVSIIFRHQNDLHLIRALLAAHGPKLNFLRLELAPGYPHGFSDLTELLAYCPRLTELIIDADWIQPHHHFDANIRLHRLGILTSRFADDIPFLQAKTVVLLRMSLPRALQSVGFLDMDVLRLPGWSDSTFRFLLSRLSQVWAAMGVRMEDMYGDAFRSIKSNCTL